MKPVKVCCFCEKWASGGIESFLCNVLLHMDLLAFQVDIVAAELADSVFTEPLRNRGIRFVELSGNQRRLRENYRLFRELLHQKKYDAVHLNIFHGLSLYYAYLSKQADIPVRIAHSHNTALRRSPARPLKLALHRWATGQYAKEATTLWACSRAAAEFLFPARELAERGYTFIPNGIDMARFRFQPEAGRAVRKKLGLDGRLVIGNVGRLCYQKNQDFLLDVFYEVMKRRPDSVLILVGDGPDRSALEKRAGRLGIAGNIIFYGTSDRVEQLLWAMDVFVMPSRFEGLPVTAVEAQVSGLLCLFSEEITTECRVSDRTKFLSIKAGPAYWAEVLLHFQRADIISDAADTIRSDFEIQAVADKVGQEWTGQKTEC